MWGAGETMPLTTLTVRAHGSPESPAPQIPGREAEHMHLLQAELAIRDPAPEMRSGEQLGTCAFLA